MEVNNSGGLFLLISLEDNLGNSKFVSLIYITKTTENSQQQNYQTNKQTKTKKGTHTLC